MKSIIATYNDDSKTIIAWAREIWLAGKQYTNEKLAFVVFDISDDEEPESITDLGPVSTMTFCNSAGESFICNRVYQQATITKRKVE